MMFSKLVEKLEEYKTENPEATVSHQMFKLKVIKYPLLLLLSPL